MMVYFLLYSSFRFDLYINIAEEYRKKGFDVCFIIQDSLSKNKIKRSGFKKNYIEFPYCRRRQLTKEQLDYYMPKLRMNTDVLSKNINLEESAYLYHCMVAFIKSLNPTRDTLFFAGNGVHVQDIALKDMKTKFGFRTIFSELANIDRKVFLDPEGSNCHSLFYKMEHCNILNDDGEIYDCAQWKNNYIRTKMSNHIVKQARNMSLGDKIFYYYFTTIDLLKKRPSYPALRIKSGYTKFKLFGKKETYKSGNIPSLEYSANLPANYLFFPLQVTNDAQILINSDYDNITALNFYKQQAEKYGLDLVLKIHPAERNINFIDAIAERAKRGEFYLSNENTFSLIMNAQKVGVNNSTVGFESIICNKETFFLGKTFYSKLIDNKWFQYYIFNYLFNADFFTGEIYEQEPINKINNFFELEDIIHSANDHLGKP